MRNLYNNINENTWDTRCHLDAYLDRNNTIAAMIAMRNKRPTTPPIIAPVLLCSSFFCGTVTVKKYFC